MIFPAVFAFGKTPDQGTTLVFQILPEIFNSLPAGGNIFGAVFFLLLCIAALTSAISIVEVPVAYLMDESNIKRTKATWFTCILIFIVGIPSALSSGGHSFFTNMSVEVFGNTYTGFLNIVDFIFGTFIITISALMGCLYSGWIYKTSNLVAEIESGASWFTKPIIGSISTANVWIFFIRIVCPLLIILVLIDMFL